MKIDSLQVLDQLVIEHTCIGAAFTSYSFDPSFFEKNVLRAVLRLTSDPIEQPDRYHDEATRALQATPVVVIVDNGMRQAGRRLPYDLLDINDRVFHPKSALLLYEQKARLMVGSGNLTSSGFSGNTELFLVLDLAYDDPADAALLRDYDAHLLRIAELTRQRGTQLRLFREEVERQLKNNVDGAVNPFVALLDSLTGPIMEQLVKLLPDDAKIQRVGMLAPFYEQDDMGDLDIDSVFGVLMKLSSPKTILDIGVRWENAQVERHSGGGVTSVKDGLDRLWGRIGTDKEEPIVEYGTPTGVGPSTVLYIDNRGDRRRLPADEVREAIEEGSFWMLPRPEAYAPAKAIAAARNAFGDVRLWLHPATRLSEGHPINRPLHAKLLSIAYRSKSSEQTLVLVGSANMSRRALLLKADAGKGNIELSMAFRLRGIHSLVDFVPELVYAPESVLELKERKFPENEHNYALAVSEAKYDPKASILSVTWAPEAAELPPWQLTYIDKPLANSSKAPTTDLTVRDFVLYPASAEIILHVGGKPYSIPILVTDLVFLPATPDGTALGLHELLMFLCRRIGAERAIEVAKRRRRIKEPNSEDDGAGLDIFFGEGFGPTDVFHAWWAVAEDICDPNISISAFRLRLEGAMGAGEAWKRLLETSGESGELSATEVWFYGAELLRSLETEVNLSAVMGATEKTKLLQQFNQRIRKDLATIRFSGDESTWVRRIQSFYGVTIP
jgi:hypothetical protein